MARIHTNLMNTAFLMMESRERRMHVATLLIYSLPPDAGADFVRQIVAGLQQSTEFVAPFNLRLKNPVLKFALPMWQEDFDLDLEYHVRHSALPYPGGERELGVLISRLHSNPMDFNRPLWEYHVIEGLEKNRFAVYFKMHHALVDGLAGLRMLQRSMSTRRDDLNTPALWSAHPPGGGLALTVCAVQLGSSWFARRHPAVRGRRGQCPAGHAAGCLRSEGPGQVAV